MANQTPRVSVGIPVYNGERYLPDALDALLAQTYADFEVIISDNASTDGTREVAEAYAARDRRIRYYRSEQNRGAAWNHNRAFELARGEYFSWNSHDDMLAPQFLARCVEVLDQDPSVVVCHARTKVVNGDKELIEYYDIACRADAPEPHVRFRELICVPHRCYQVYGLIRSEVLRQTPLIAPYVPSDRVLLAYLGLLGRFHEIPEYLFISRRHPGQSTRALRLRQRAGWFDTSRSGRLIFPQWKVFYEYVRAVREVPLSAGERARAYGAVARWVGTNWNWARMANDLVVAGRQIARDAAGSARGRAARTSA